MGILKNLSSKGPQNSLFGERRLVFRESMTDLPAVGQQAEEVKVMQLDLETGSDPFASDAEVQAALLGTQASLQGNLDATLGSIGADADQGKTFEQKIARYEALVPRFLEEVEKKLGDLIQGTSDDLSAACEA